MRKRLCPQCLIANLYVKNSNGDRLPVFVTTDYEIVPSKEGCSLDGFDLEVVYCLGCSWSGPLNKLRLH